nr:reverse transcriptase domain-containing protein [Tanacetum cinerariifolium]
MPRECLKIIESKSKVRQTRAKAVVAKVGTSSSTLAISTDVAELKDMVKALLLDKKNQSLAPTPSTTPAPVKAVVSNCVTCGGAHSYQNCLATQENAYRDNIQEYVSQAAAVNQALVYQAPIPQTQSVSQIDFKSYVKANDAILRNIQSQGQSMQNQCQNIQNQNQNLQNQMATLMEMMSKLISANTASSSGGVAYLGPKTPSQSKQGTKVTKDQVQTPSSQSTAPVQPSVIQSESQDPVSEPVVAPVSAPMPNLKPSIPYPSRRENEKRRDQANEQIEKFYEIFKEMSFEIRFTDALILMPKFASTLKALIGNMEKLSEMAQTMMNEHCSATSRALIDVHKGELTLRIGNEAITYNLDQTVRYSTNYNQMTANKIDFVESACEEYSQEEADAFLGLEDDPDSPKINPFYYDPEGDILLLEAILNSEPSPPLLNQEQNLPSFKEELKAYEAQTVKSFVDEPPEVELKDLPHHLEYAFLEGNNKLPVIIAKELRSEEKAALIKKEVEKLLDAGLIYPISDSPWVSPVHCVPKKGGFTVVENEENELIPTRLVTGWQMLERLAGNEYYCFLDGFSGYFKIPIDPRDQEKTTFTCPYGTFAYHRMPFGLCNAPGTFQRCMLEIFHDMVEKTMEVFMDDFSIFRNSFENCLSRLEKMLQRCEDTHLSLKWEKSHFMVKEGIVLGHKISKNGIEVDKAKIDVIAKLPHPTTVKGTFQRCMLAIFHDMVEKTMEVFMDDFSVFGNSFENCLSRLDKILQRCEDTNLSLNWEKSHFMVKEGIVLGHKISKNRIEVDKAEIDVIAKLPHPTTVKEYPVRVLQRMYLSFPNIEEKTYGSSNLNCPKLGPAIRAYVRRKRFHHRFGSPRAIISDRGTHSCNEQFSKVMLKYGVTHRLSTTYHPQTSGQVEVSNRGLKRILERTIGENRASWSDKLDDALWAFAQRTKHPSGVLLTSWCMERPVIFRSSSSIKPIGP